MDHTKFVVVDNKWICVGSWNCWLRAHFYEAETNIVVDNAQIGARLVRDEMDFVTRDKLVDVGDITIYNAAMLREEGAIVAARLGHSGDAFSAKFLQGRGYFIKREFLCKPPPVVDSRTTLPVVEGIRRVRQA